MKVLKICILAVSLLAVLLMITAVINSGSASAQGPPDGLAVRIISPLPIPTQGSSTITGTVAANQSGVWNVGILGTPNVNVANLPSASTATLVNEVTFTATSTISANNPTLGPIDVSGAKTIRLNLQKGSSTGGGGMQVEVYSGFDVIEVISLPTAPFLSPGSFASRVYEVPGGALTLRFANSQAGTVNDIRVAVYARSN